jgi:beta-glucosidase
VRIEIAAGQTRRVCFQIDPSQLAFYDADLRLVVESGTIEVAVGASSEDLRSRASFEIVGKLRELTPAELLPGRVTF